MMNFQAIQQQAGQKLAQERDRAKSMMSDAYNRFTNYADQKGSQMVNAPSSVGDYAMRRFVGLGRNIGQAVAGQEAVSNEGPQQQLVQAITQANTMAMKTTGDEQQRWFTLAKQGQEVLTQIVGQQGQTVGEEQNIVGNVIGTGLAGAGMAGMAAMSPAALATTGAVGLGLGEALSIPSMMRGETTPQQVAAQSIGSLPEIVGAGAVGSKLMGPLVNKIVGLNAAKQPAFLENIKPYLEIMNNPALPAELKSQTARTLGRRLTETMVAKGVEAFPGMAALGAAEPAESGMDRLGNALTSGSRGALFSAGMAAAPLAGQAVGYNWNQMKQKLAPNKQAVAAGTNGQQYPVDVQGSQDSGIVYKKGSANPVTDQGDQYTWKSKPGDKFLIKGYTTDGKPFSSTYGDWETAKGINLWTGKKYLVRGGEKFLIEDTYNGDPVWAAKRAKMGAEIQSGIDDLSSQGDKTNAPQPKAGGDIRSSQAYKKMDSYNATGMAEGWIDATPEQQLAAWQKLVDTGQAWQLQGWFGRTAQELLDSGQIQQPIQTHADYYGNTVKGTGATKTKAPKDEYADLKRYRREQEEFRQESDEPTVTSNIEKSEAKKAKTGTGPGAEVSPKANIKPSNVNRLTLDDLEAKKTIKSGQTDDLKIDTGDTRVWLSRMTKEDGMPYNNQVTVEKYTNGVWKTVKEYQAFPLKDTTTLVNAKGEVARPFPRNAGEAGPGSHSNPSNEIPKSSGKVTPIEVNSDAINAVNEGNEVPKKLDGFTLKYHKTDAWRGYYEAVPDKGSGWKQIHSDWVTGNWDDAGANSSSSQEKRMADINKKVNALGGTMKVVMTPTSNVFSTGFDVFVKGIDDISKLNLKENFK